MLVYELFCCKFKNDNKLCFYVIIIKCCIRLWECLEYICVVCGVWRENKKYNVKNF